MRIDVLGWLLIPNVATVIALAIMGFRHRSRPPVDAEEGMAELARFRAAMDRPLPDLNRPDPASQRSTDDAEPDDRAGRP